MSNNCVLEVKDVVQRFGGLTVLNNINMTFKENAVTGIIGPNGAGKTTLFNVMTGVYTPTEGSVWLAGENVTGLASWKIARKGFARTFQNIRLFQSMTVLDNVLSAMMVKGKSTLFETMFNMPRKKKEDKEFEAKAEEILKIVGLWDERYTRAGALPYGPQRRLEIARALATEPKILLLDEPAAGMNELETMELSETVRQLKESGYTILLIEHDMKFVMSICEHIYVLNYGEQIAEGTPEEVVNNPIVVEAYIGKEDN